MRRFAADVLAARDIEIEWSLDAPGRDLTLHAELRVTINTICFHIRRIYYKLHVHSKSEAVAKALRERIGADLHKSLGVRLNIGS